MTTRNVQPYDPGAVMEPPELATVFAHAVGMHEAGQRSQAVGDYVVGQLFELFTDADGVPVRVFDPVTRACYPRRALGEA